jgi:hypothetical protein
MMAKIYNPSAILIFFTSLHLFALDQVDPPLPKRIIFDKLHEGFFYFGDDLIKQAVEVSPPENPLIPNDKSNSLETAPKPE